MWAWEFEDSEVAAWQQDGPALSLRLAATHLVPRQASLGAGQEAAFQGGWTLHLQEAQVLQQSGEALGRIRQGRLELAGQAHRRWPLAQAIQEPLRLTLDFAHGAQWVVLAQGMRLEGAPQAPLCPALQC